MAAANRHSDNRRRNHGLGVELLNRSDERNRRGVELLIASAEVLPLLLPLLSSTPPTERRRITSNKQQPHKGQESKTHKAS